MFKKLKLIMAMLLLVGVAKAQNELLTTSGTWDNPNGNEIWVTGNVTVTLTGDVTVNDMIVINDGATLTINLPADGTNSRSRTIKRGTCTDALFHIGNYWHGQPNQDPFPGTGGKLIIQGRSSTKTITLDGGATWRKYNSGSPYYDNDSIRKFTQDCFDLTNTYTGETVRGAVLANNKISDRALIFSWRSTFTLNYVKIQNNYVRPFNWGIYERGGGILVYGQTGGDISITNSTICNCQNTWGGGGAIFFVGDDWTPYDAKSKTTITNCNFYGCADYSVSHEPTQITECSGGGAIRTDGPCFTSLTVTNCKFHHCYSSEKGGAIFWNSKDRVNSSGQVTEPITISLSNCEFGYNVSRKSGGGAAVEGTMTIQNCKFHHNEAMGHEPGEGYGGGLSAQTFMWANTSYNTQLSLDANTEIYNNKAKYGGGVSYKLIEVEYLHENTYNLDFSINGTKIHDNQASVNGGAVYVGKQTDKENYTGTFTMNSGYLYSNTATGNGGAVYTEGGIPVVIKGGYIGRNANNYGTTAAPNTAVNGGGFYCKNGNVTMTGGEIINNTCTADGGGFYAIGGNVNISGASTKLKDNMATGNGGGFYSSGSDMTVTIKQASLSENTANKGGAIYVNSEGSSTTTIKDEGQIVGNNALEGAGGYIDGGTLQIENCNIDDNKASADGGGFYVNGGTLNLYGGIIGQTEGNRATGNGGGFYVNGGVANIKKAPESSTSATVQLNTAANGAGLYMAGNAEANFEDGTIQNNGTTSGNGGGIYLADNSQLKMSGTSTITGNHVPDGQKGGGVFKQGGTNTLLWVSGEGLKIVDNYAGNTVNRSNAYLNSYYDYITVDETYGLTDQVKLGISVNVTNLAEDLPTPIIHSESMDVINDIFYLLKHPTGDNGVFDDAAHYVAVYQSTPDPFNDNEIFFMGTWAVDVGEVPPDFIQEGSDGSERVDISSPEGLSWFMILVNGLNGHQAHPDLACTMVADINLEGSYWTPIGEWDHNDPGYGIPEGGVGHKPKPVYRGVFDGQGHTISIVSTCGIIGYYNYGLFGRTENATVKNIVLADCSLVAGEAARMGGLIGEMNGGTVENCTVSGNINPSGSETIEDNPYSCVLGGLIGETKGECQIRNCIATEEINATAKEGTIYPGMQAYTVGGLVGITSKNTIIENCFSNPEIHHSGAQGKNTTLTEWDRYVGGIVGENAGTIRNCYVRLERGNQFTGEELMGPVGSTTSKPVSKFGMFAGRNAVDVYERVNISTEENPVYSYSWISSLNTGAIENCYAPDVDVFDYDYTYTYLYNDGTSGCTTNRVTNYGDYGKVIAPYTYNDYLKDNKVTKINGSTAEDGIYLLDMLNGWVDRPHHDNTASYSHWMRTKGSTVNDDYPVLRYDNLDGTLNYTVVGSKDRVHLEYDNSFNDMYGRFEPGKKGCLFIYKTPWTGTIDNQQAETITANNMADDNHISIYVEEDVALLQDGNAPTLKNVYTCQVLKGEAWHTVASSLTGSKIGFEYGKTGQAWSESQNPCDVTLTGSANSIFPTDTPIESLDLYSFYEPQYHWVNLKRNQDSHWHMNSHETPITYDETLECGYDEDYFADNDKNDGTSTLVPGKGYLAAIVKDMILQGDGMLTNGEVKVPVSVEAGSYNTTTMGTEGTELKGYNLLGNPYQSYLSFSAFANGNDLWNGTPSFAVYDGTTDTYVQGTVAVTSKGSFAATGNINMHQGFFIVADKAGTATFTNAMRSDKPEDGTHFRGEAPAYPLVNLVVTDESGVGDVAVVEFDRPEYQSAAKMKHIGADGKIYFHHNGGDQALLFLDEPTDHLPVHFDAIADGTYTMTWSTANATFSYLHLIDNMTGIDVDMLTSDAYTFTASSSDYKSRFKLMFAYTGVEENEAASTSSASFAFMHDGALTVNGEGWLEVIDMSGRTIVSSRLTDAQNTVSLPQAAQGVYVLRLTSNNMTKVQKIVVE